MEHQAFYHPQNFSVNRMVHTGGCSGVVIVSLLEWGVGGERIEEYGQKSQRRDVSPRDFPIDAQLDIQHEFHVLDEPVQSWKGKQLNNDF